MTPTSTLTSSFYPTTDAHSVTPVSSDQPPTVLRCNGTADFLAALPFLTGFTAENSLFIVLFSGRRAGKVVRIDLPPDESSAVASTLIDAICELMASTGLGAEGPAVVITSDQTFAEAGGAPRRQFARLLRRRFRREGWPLRELAVVAADGWAGLLDPKSPREGRSLSEIGASPISTQAREAVDEPVSLTEVGNLPDPNPEHAAAVIARLAELDQREATRKPPPGAPIGLPTWLHGVARVAGACFEDSETTPDPRLCARLIRAAESPESWLVVLLAAVTRPEFVIGLAEAVGVERMTEAPIGIDFDAAKFVDFASEVSQEPENGEDQDWSYHLMLYSLGMTRPDSAKPRQLIAVLSKVAAHTPSARQPGLLSLLAWAWWMLGLQSVAMQLIDTSLKIDSSHELSRMIERLIDTPAGWSRQPDHWIE